MFLALLKVKLPNMTDWHIKHPLDVTKITLKEV